jgi:L-asparaginase II
MIELVQAVRNGYVESRHRGTLVLLAPSAAPVIAGDVDAPVFPRSSLKPLQAVAMVEAGFPGRNDSLALACASHDGEPVHVAGARATLAAAGQDEGALRCPPDLPSSRAALIKWIAAGGRPASICHNCSGKHSAMVATCFAAGWPVAPDDGAYVDPSHPLQQAIRRRIETLAGPVSGVAVDGCGAPAFAVSLRGLAGAFATLATATDGTERLVADAMRAHPVLIGGSERAVSDLTAAVPGLVCKEGAEGVWAAALPDGRAFAAKLADGGGRALPPLLAAVLRYWGFAGEAIERWSHVPVLGGGRPVGELTWTPELASLLRL